jgi:hypothetical protein
MCKNKWTSKAMMESCHKENIYENLVKPSHLFSMGIHEMMSEIKSKPYGGWMKCECSRKIIGR